MRAKSLPFLKDDVIYKNYLPIVKNIKDGHVRINEWDIPYTIPELSYLVHSHYRYYGKFPSVVAGQILEMYPPPSKSHYVLDNFCGSGTTQVEAKLRGIASYGTDISWLSALVSNVKTTHLRIEAVGNELKQIVDWFNSNTEKICTPEDDFVAKWFDETAAKDLSILQKYILSMPGTHIRDFLLVAFVGIVRRVSKAYDGEVRPHINKDKKQRDVLSAFSKKVHDMCHDHSAFMQLSSGDVISESYVANNRKLLPKFNDGFCYLVISHPPYLNSFNYAPVFSLEYYWSQPFEKMYAPDNEKLYKTELKAHPANESITTRYFDHLEKCYEQTFRIQEKGSHLAVVIGDCTRKGKVVPVIDRCIERIEKVGYTLTEINYRTTHYGLGKYAYRHRADYHGDQNEKKDAIIFFKK